MNLKQDKIMITGGCGFIGTAIIRRLRAHNPATRIIVLDNFATGSANDLASVAPFEWVTKGESPSNSSHVALAEGDVRDYSKVALFAEGCDAIVHLAANTGVGPSVDNPRLDMEVNVGGTFNVLEAARANRIPKVIFASSGAPLGEVEPPIHEELAPHPVSPYGASKLAGEAYCSAYNKTFGINTVALRFGNVYGPGSGKKTSVVAKFIRQALEGKPCVIFGDGNQTRDFIYIDDLTNAIFLSLQRQIGGETFQIATGREHSIAEVSAELQRCLATMSVDLEVVYDSPRLGDVSRSFSDVSKAKSTLGWEAETNLEIGLEKTVRWFLEKEAPI